MKEKHEALRQMEDGGVRALIEERDALKSELAFCTEYATDLFKSVAPQCIPFETLRFVLTQIDNAMTEIPKLRAELASRMSDPTHTVQLWVAADEDGTVNIHDGEKPYKHKSIPGRWVSLDFYGEWDRFLLGPTPEITWKDEPRRVTVSVGIEAKEKEDEQSNRMV